MNKRWAKEDVEHLIKNYSITDNKDLAIHLDRNTQSIRNKSKKLGLKKDKNLYKGQRFGKLIVIEKSEKKSGLFGQSIYVCLCDCGNIKEIARKSLVANHTRSCGCLSKELFRESVSLPPGEASFNRLYYRCKINAKTRSLIFELSKDEYKNIINENCFYCGATPTLWNIYIRSDGTTIERYNTKYSNMTIENAWVKANSVDRRDNDRGYTKENCVPCCWPCNEMKMARTETEFLDHINKIQKFKARKDRNPNEIRT